MGKVRKIKTSNTDLKLELPEEAGKPEISLRNAAGSGVFGAQGYKHKRR